MAAIRKLVAEIWFVGAWILGVVGMIVACALFVSVIISPFDYFACHGQWDKSGLGVKWGMVSGCQVEVGPNRWVPSTTFRAIEP